MSISEVISCPSCKLRFPELKLKLAARFLANDEDVLGMFLSLNTHKDKQIEDIMTNRLKI